MTNEEIVSALALFLRDETLDECPINIISRNDIEGEDAEFIWFTFGDETNMCPAIAWNSGDVFTPTDWQTDWNTCFENVESAISTVSWMDCNFRECIIFNGMPRRFL